MLILGGSTARAQPEHAPEVRQIGHGCGATCVAVYARRVSDSRITFREAQRATDPDGDGVCSIADLQHALRSLGLEVEAYERPSKSLPRVPAILWVSSSTQGKAPYDHFIVTEPAARGRFVVLSPIWNEPSERERHQCDLERSLRGDAQRASRLVESLVDRRHSCSDPDCWPSRKAEGGGLSFLRLTGFMALTIAGVVLCPRVIIGVRTEHQGVLEFEPGRMLELGTLEPGTHDVALRVRNISAEDVVFDSVSASCGCTAAELKVGSLRPGRETTVDLRLEVAPHAEKTVVVFVDLRKPSVQRQAAMLTFRAGRGARLRTQPSAVHEADIAPGVRTTIDVHVYAVDESMANSPVQWTLRDTRAGLFSVEPRGWGADASGRRRASALLSVRELDPGVQVSGSLEVKVGAARADIPIRLEAARCVEADSPTVLLSRTRNGEFTGQLRVAALPGWSIRRVTADPGVQLTWSEATGWISVAAGSSAADALWSALIVIECRSGSGLVTETRIPVIRAWE